MVINRNEIVAMKVITQERQYSIGSVEIILIFEHLSIEHKIHVVRDDFPMPSHGIIGKDFLKAYSCGFDYFDMTFTVRPENSVPAKIPIQCEILNGLSVLPPRSETFKLFKIKSNKFPCIVERQEVAKDVFIPTTVIHSRESWIRVLNTNSVLTYIQTDKLPTLPIEDYDIFCVSEHKPNANVSRQALLKQTISSKIPSHAFDKLFPLCDEFSDIFHLPGDKPTTNNFYCQKLNLRDTEPVFVKNYRLPQSQKEEISRQV